MWLIAKYLIELVCELSEAAGSGGLQFSKFTVLIEFLLVVVNVTGYRQIIVQADAHIPPAVFAEDSIAIRIDVFGILQAEFQHRRNGVLEAVGTYEVSGLCHLLNRQKSGVDTSGVGGLILLLYERKQHALRLLQRVVLLILRPRPNTLFGNSQTDCQFFCLGLTFAGDKETKKKWVQ